MTVLLMITVILSIINGFMEAIAFFILLRYRWRSQEYVQLKIVLTESFYFVVDKLQSFSVKHLGLIDDIIPEIRIRRIWRPNPYGKNRSALRRHWVGKGQERKRKKS